MPSPNTCFLLPGRVRDVLDGNRAGGEEGREGGEEERPALGPVWCFPSALPTQRADACWETVAAQLLTAGRIPKPSVGCRAGGESELRGESPSESVTGLSGPGTRSNSFEARVHGLAWGASRVGGRACLVQLGGSSSAFTLSFGKGLGARVSRALPALGVCASDAP